MGYWMSFVLYSYFYAYRLGFIADFGLRFYELSNLATWFSRYPIMPIVARRNEMVLLRSDLILLDAFELGDQEMDRIRGGMMLGL
jgi:hypothetical protein